MEHRNELNSEHCAVELPKDEYVIDWLCGRI